jgi:hypothetical protein
MLRLGSSVQLSHLMLKIRLEFFFLGKSSSELQSGFQSLKGGLGLQVKKSFASSERE